MNLSASKFLFRSSSLSCNRRRQHLSIRRGQLHHAHVVSGNIHEIWIRKMQIIARHARRKVVFQPKREAKPVEPARNQQIQISQPEILGRKATACPRARCRNTGSTLRTSFAGFSSDWLRHVQRRCSRLRRTEPAPPIPAARKHIPRTSLPATNVAGIPAYRPGVSANDSALPCHAGMCGAVLFAVAPADARATD